MNAEELANEAAEKYASRNAKTIAEKCGIKIVYARWSPVTSGEFDHRAKIICINENAAVLREKIIAHELGHFFIKEYGIETDDAEKFCDEFAESLLNAVD